MMRFLYAKINLEGGNTDTKIAPKSGKLDKVFLRFGGM